MEQIIVTLATQCPVIGLLIWHHVYLTKQFKESLNRIVDKLADRMENMADRLERIETSVQEWSETEQ